MSWKGTKEQRRVYDNARYERRMTLLCELLGGQCSRCGSASDLDIDHIDSSTKSFTIGSSWTKPWTEILEEVKGCQLLCRPCHIVKSYEAGENPPPSPHGLSRYKRYKCRCSVCKAANNEYSRKYRSDRQHR